MTIVTINAHIVLVVLEGNQFLSQRNHHKADTLILTHTHRSQDVNTILSRGVNTEVVAQLHTRNLSVIREHPVDTILQETDDVGVGNSNNDHVAGTQLQLQSTNDTLEVLTRSLHPFRNGDRITLIGQSIEATFNDHGIVTKLVVLHASLITTLLSLEGVHQEGLDLSILEVGQSRAHHVDVICNDIDLLKSQSIGSIFDRHSSIQTRTRLRHNLLNLLNATDHVQRALIEAVGSLTTEADLSHGTSGRHNSDLTILEVHAANQLIGQSLLNLATVSIKHIVLDSTLNEVVSGDIDCDIGGHSMLSTLAILHHHRADMNTRGQLHSVVAGNNTRDVVGINQRQILTQTDVNGIFLDVQTGRGIDQVLDELIIIQSLRQRILIALQILQITTLKAQLDDRSLRNLGHQDILEDTVDPLLLQEEGVISHDGRITSHDGLSSDGIQRVVQQLLHTISIVAIEGRLRSGGIGKESRIGQRLSHSTNKVLLVLVRGNDIRQIMNQVHTLLGVALKHGFDFILKTGIGIGSRNVANHTTGLLVTINGHG